jgi:CRP-like cAMP-binding protein
VLAVLLRFLRERLIHRLVRTSPLFRIFSESKRAAIVRRFRFLEVADGHPVIEQHRPTEAVFILLSGRMQVVHRDGASGDAGESGERVLATLTPGELFGEMSLLWREPSLASVVARGKCWLLALPTESFQEMLDHHPELAELAARIANERREKNARTLRDALGHRDGKAGII